MAEANILNIVADRVAEVVNRKLGKVVERVDSLERKIRALEAEVNALRAREIETIIHAFIKANVKEQTEIIVNAVAQRIGAEVARLEATVREIALKLAEAAEMLEKASSSITVDFTPVMREIEKLASAIAGVVAATEALRKSFENMAQQITRLEAELKQLNQRVSKLEASVALTKSGIDQLLTLEQQRITKLRELFESEEEEEESGGEES